ncbi:uncharacterized protein [Dysidea avara]|uniref:uncharacterized protein n=1 Tax=Dysidea avara TaxID=196820 RepID=UPI00332ACDB3
MEQRLECNNIGGWTRIASVNITRGDECPTGWNKSSHDGISFCRSPSDSGGCYPVVFSSKEINYQKVCGMARGYQKGTIDAFVPIWVDTDVGLDGLTITHGSYASYIWSYVAGICPCAAHPDSSYLPPSFIGSNYYCESGNNNSTIIYPNIFDTYFLHNPLWDGLGCPTGNTCCDNPNLPWFYRELDMATVDDVEVRICANEAFSNEALLVDQLELELDMATIDDIEVGLCTNDTFSDEQVLVDQLELYIQ